MQKIAAIPKEHVIMPRLDFK